MLLRRPLPRLVILAVTALGPFSAVGCDDGPSGPATDVGEAPSTYAFESRFLDGTSSVAYDGQVARHVLIADLARAIGNLTEDIDADTLAPTADGDVLAILNFYFEFDSEVSGAETLGLSTTPPTLQRKYDDVSTGKDLIGKLAGNDSTTDFKDWTTAFRGWSDEDITASGGSVDSPAGLVNAFFETLEEAAIAYQDGTPAEDPDGNPLPVHVTASGLDLQQLVQKFLLMAITFHQAADDYLDDETEDAGILAANGDPSAEDSPHTPLEHAWDEAFGYFGAARDYGDYTDDELAASGDGRDDWQGYHDSNDDGSIDLLSEYNFGASTNAAKRDRGSVEATDFTTEAFRAFVRGRHLIAASRGNLSAGTLGALKTERNRAILAWEQAIAATVVHYINDTLKAMALFTTDDYDFLEHAKGWSEMKGFALGLQFNPRSPLSEDDFESFHALVGDAPVLPSASVNDADAYRTKLRMAREILGDAYGFAEENLGDDDGNGGW